MSIDASEVRAFGVQLGVAALAAPVAARGVMQKAGLSVKNDARQRISGLRHAPSYPNSIAFETKVSGAGIEVEVGPTVGGPQWGLGDILEYGTPKSAPHPHLLPAAERELPVMEKFLIALVTKTL